MGTGTWLAHMPLIVAVALILSHQCLGLAYKGGLEASNGSSIPNMRG